MSTVSMKFGAWAGWEGGCELKISLIVEGKTEKVFIPKLREYLESSSFRQNARFPGSAIQRTDSSG